MLFLSEISYLKEKHPAIAQPYCYSQTFESACDEGTILSSQG